MDKVKVLQVFPQLAINHVIASLEPIESRHIVGSLGRVVEIDQNVVIRNQIVKCCQNIPKKEGNEGEDKRRNCENGKSEDELMGDEYGNDEYSHEKVIHDVIIVTSRSVWQITGCESDDRWTRTWNHDPIDGIVRKKKKKKIDFHS